MPPPPLTLGSLQNQMDGMTGSIQIDSAGRRTHFRLDVVEYFMGQFKKVGWWETGRGVNRTQTDRQKQEEIQKALQFKTFIVASRIVSYVITSFVSPACSFVCPPVRYALHHWLLPHLTGHLHTPVTLLLSRKPDYRGG
jgi:hypothetical protein